LVATARETPLWVIAGESAAVEREHVLQAAGAEVLRVPAAGGRLDLKAALTTLAGRGITRAMVEAGPIVAAAFVTAGLVDKVAMFRSPKPIGPDGIDALEGLPLDALTKSPQLVSAGIEAVGEDTLETLRRR
jgi:diaminohydroxyphosphoribosylaminopyrimidine deaminase/5-amino-6-(5-phosphoribosylamino)uracil reductase